MLGILIVVHVQRLHTVKWAQLLCKYHCELKSTTPFDFNWIVFFLISVLFECVQEARIHFGTISSCSFAWLCAVYCWKVRNSVVWSQNRYSNKCWARENGQIHMDGHGHRWRWAQHRNALTVYRQSDGRVSVFFIWLTTTFEIFFFKTVCVQSNSYHHQFTISCFCCSFRNQFTIVPILVGSIPADVEATYGEILAPYLADSQNLFVISSDFCHWGKRFSYTYFDEGCGAIHKSIEKLDKNVCTNWFTWFAWQMRSGTCNWLLILFLIVCISGNEYYWNIKSSGIYRISKTLQQYDLRASPNWCYVAGTFLKPFL